MKHLLTILIFVLIISFADARSILKTDTTVNPSKNTTFVQVEVTPEYPGGMNKFAKYIGSSLQYPEVAQLIGLEGNVVVSFVVERDGKIADVKPVRCLGAGCKSEAVRVIEGSKAWKPGLQDGRPVRVQYTIPVAFSFRDGNKKTSVKIKDLKKSNYGFVISENGKIYTLDEAEAAFGKTIDSKKIATAEQCFDEKYYPMPGKKDVYMIILRS